MGFPCGSADTESPCNVGDLGSIPGLGRSPGEGKGYPLQYSGLDPYGCKELNTTERPSLKMPKAFWLYYWEQGVPNIKKLKFYACLNTRFAFSCLLFCFQVDSQSIWEKIGKQRHKLGLFTHHFNTGKWLNCIWKAYHQTIHASNMIYFYFWSIEDKPIKQF